MGESSPALRAWVGIVSFLQLGAAVAVILMTYYKTAKIDSFSLDAGARTYNSTGTCALDPTPGNTGLCIYAYTIGGVSIIATFIVSLLLCCTCDCCGCGPIFEFLFAAAGTAWWAVASIVLMEKAFQADSAGVLLHGWRMATWIVSWVATGLFLVIAALSFVRSCNLLCGCCTRDRQYNYA